MTDQIRTPASSLALAALSFLLLLASPAGHATASDESTSARPANSPRAPFPTEVYWGDTHLHSNLSLDAGTAGPAAGGIEMTPEVAYRFARGEAIEMGASGLVARLSRPLDFLVVSDHAEYLGIASKIRMGDPKLLASPGGQRWLGAIRAKAIDGEQPAILIGGAAFLGMKLLDPALAEPYVRSAWAEQVRVADRYDDPGRFTALIGFEWSAAPQGNLHRNVIYRDGADRAGRKLPFSALDSLDPVDLWQFMADYERETGGQVLAIPHNSNLSNGLLFARTDPRGALAA